MSDLDSLYFKLQYFTKCQRNYKYTKLKAAILSVYLHNGHLFGCNNFLCNLANSLIES